MNKITLLFLFIIPFQIAFSQELLFNGKDLSGWIVNGTEKWYVEDGLLVCESGSEKNYGYLTTEKNFKDFILDLEFKQESNGNSGVFFRSNVNGTIVSGWQVEVAPPNLHTGGIYESYGRGWLIKPSLEKEKYLKMGQWNQLKIIAKGDMVQTYLNGHLMAYVRDQKIGEGVGGIALQIHSGGGIKIKWKNIKIQEL
ncbi:MAG: 3-keto-disaccharide hydrolase [Flavobacteriaceae bacterium]